MLKSYFRLAVCILLRNKVYTFINVLGLSLGISACIVIYLVSSYELSFDRDHLDGERIYRVGGRVQESRGNGPEEVLYTEDIPLPATGALQKEIPVITKGRSLLSRDLFILMGIALLIASPVAWYGLNRWLQAFAYRAGISWRLFLTASCTGSKSRVSYFDLTQRVRT